MVIRPSSAAEIRSLIGALAGSDAVQREAAIARLSVLGARAVDRLLTLYRGTTDPHIQTAVFRALEPIGDRRALPAAAEALRRGGDPAIAAAGVLHELLVSRDDAAASDAFDSLVSAAVDAGAERRVRVAAFEALDRIPDPVRSRVGVALGQLLAPGGTSGTTVAAAALWGDALNGRLPDDPTPLREIAASCAASSSPASLRKLIEAVRAVESEAPASRAAVWRALRGALHQALALRKSRVAAYDLRESLEGASGPLPASFLAAIHAVGDASFIEPLAAALSRAPEDNLLWRHQLASAFRAVARRERLTRRHAVIKRAAARWRGVTLPI